MKIDFNSANSVDPDEMLHSAAFHLGLHSGIFSAILGRGPRAFQIWKISVVNP